MLAKIAKRVKDREIAKSIGMTPRAYRKRKALLLRQAEELAGKGALK